MADNANKPKPVKLENTKQQKTEGGHPGGQNKYDQSVFGDGNKFVIHNPIKGHTQQQNVDDPMKK